ncbi:histidine phosphatase family protein [Bacillus kexueae]|uniref:histidine phosphatase family protein n=1 Tax=Aeribacillus kexueae TaxID=2078952 RepID=UPI001FAF82EA|nr:histidine phosphatase family protein [Bacillus kexueae]
MVTIYLTRHGQTEWNVEKRMQGWLDSPLTEEGKKAVEHLGERLKDVSFDAIYHSPSLRTDQTANILLNHLTIDRVEKDERLKEIHLGHWEAKTQAELKELYTDDFHAFFNEPHHYEAKSGEHFHDVQERVISFLNDLLNKHQEGNILVVTHGVWLKVLMNYVKNEPLAQLWEGPFQHGTSLSILKVEDGQFIIEKEACTDHLMVAKR